MLKQKEKLTKDFLFNTLKNPTTDYIYTKTKPDILQQIATALKTTKEELYKYLEIDEQLWQNKLNDFQQITVEEILQLADIAKVNINIGKPLKIAAFYIIQEDKKTFNENLKKSIKEFTDTVLSISANKNLKGFISDRCGSKVMTSIKDETNIKKHYSLSQSFEQLNQLLFGLSINLEYSPDKTQTADKKVETLEEQTAKLIEKLNLIPYSAPPKLAKVNEKIKQVISEIDPYIFNIIFNIKPNEFEKLSFAHYLSLMAIAGEDSITDENTTSIDNLEEIMQNAMMTILQIPSEYIEAAAIQLNIPKNYFEIPFNNIHEPQSFEYFNTLTMITGRSYKLTKEFIENTINWYKEELKNANLLKPELLKAEAKMISAKDILAVEKSAKQVIHKAKTKSEEKMVKQTSKPTIQENQIQINNLMGAILPLIRNYYHLDLGETFKINGVEMRITKEADTEKLINAYGDTISPIKNSKEIALLVSGNTSNFEYSKFEPAAGDTYWTFNLPINLEPITRIYGENQIADSISKNYNIIYRNEYQIKRTDIEKIKAKFVS
mgnify:CR=1 FL=1